MNEHKNTNQVLHHTFPLSQNFYQSDLMFRHFIHKETSQIGRDFMESRWLYTGEAAAGRMNSLSLTADKNGPTLVKRNFYGEDINEIRFHPAYHELTDIAIKSGMFSVKWMPLLRQRFQTERHRLGFASGFLFAMSESGLYCPLCMTDGVARLIDRYCTAEDKANLLPHIYTEELEALLTGAMFLTEKAGGSDVGANLVTATQTEPGSVYYRLNGEKWFCSNANAGLIFALARTNQAVKGTRGLSIFLIEKTCPDGSKNEKNIVRLKDKLGVRSMASAEIILTDTIGKMIGKEGDGFKIMTDMINLSRLYNSIAAISASRRALIEAYQFLQNRITFGTTALNHALIREKLKELSAVQTANFYLTWYAIKMLDLADNDHLEAKERIRLLTPMVKKTTAETGVYIIRESMELMGGMGYIEDGVLPKLMRDAMVLPIWEGAGNIMILDMLRASIKSKGLSIICEDIRTQFEQIPEQDDKSILLTALQEVVKLSQSLTQHDRHVTETTAKPLFERLTLLYKIAVLLMYKDEESKDWISPSIRYLTDSLYPRKLKIKEPISRSNVEKMMAWQTQKT